uniref:Methyltransferase small domain-containing protein n=3 Tax=Rhodosorus marinus TaxID=101924 RepID=A0A7S2ZQ27_9RHOD|mmetsp:Transcript_27944/g.109651  ORF Transcript_27944/g.109651 Transcript_27944/m.109651 type:complete len:299 (+) Transcript_27944:476-1372(+)
MSGAREAGVEAKAVRRVVFCDRSYMRIFFVNCVSRASGENTERLKPAVCEARGPRGNPIGMTVDARSEQWYTRRKRDRWSELDLERLPTELRPNEGETLDLFLRKKVLLLQSRRGYRANTDSQILAYFATRRREARGLSGDSEHRALDLGAGNALVSVLYGNHNRGANMQLVELQGGLAARAARNLALNGLVPRSTVVCHDLAHGLPSNTEGKMDVVLCNPPFYRDINSRSPPTRKEKLLAHFESSVDIVGFAKVAFEALVEGSQTASAYFVYDAIHSERLYDGLMKGGKNMRPDLVE